MVNLSRNRLAEWLLRLALPDDRAAAALGDWLEDAGQRGSAWFWSCVCRTLSARILNDFTESPGRLILLAFGSYVFTLVPIAAMLLLFQSGWMGPLTPGSFAVAWSPTLTIIDGFVTINWMVRFTGQKRLAVCLISCLPLPFILGAISLTLPGFAGSPVCQFVTRQSFFLVLGFMFGTLLSSSKPLRSAKV